MQSANASTVPELSLLVVQLAGLAACLGWDLAKLNHHLGYQGPW